MDMKRTAGPGHPSTAPAFEKATGSDSRKQAVATARQAPEVEVRIDSLVLTGFRPEDRHRIGSALQAELARLLVEHGVPPGLEGGLDTGVLRASALDLPFDAHPSAVGARLARSLYGALKGELRP